MQNRTILLSSVSNQVSWVYFFMQVSQFLAMRLLLKILSSHEWVTLGIALFTTQSWAITSVSGKALLARPVYIHLLNRLHQV